MANSIVNRLCQVKIEPKKNYCYGSTIKEMGIQLKPELIELKTIKEIVDGY